MSSGARTPSSPASPTFMERQQTAAPGDVRLDCTDAATPAAGVSCIELNDDRSPMVRCPSDPNEHSGAGYPSNTSFTRGLPLTTEVSPSVTPEASRTAVTTPEGGASIPTNADDAPRRLSDDPAECSFRDHDFIDVGESPTKRTDSNIRNLARGAAKPVNPPTTRIKIRKALQPTPAGFAVLCKELPEGLARGDYYVRLTDDGTGGTYYVFASCDPTTPLAVFKPADEEVGADGNPRDASESVDERFESGCFTAGQGYQREALAYELDHGRQAGVPPTAVVELDGQVGSLQRFVPRMMQSWSTTPAKFNAAAVQAIAVFDIRVLNCDRHGGNLLVPKDGPGLTMVPIDHGFILPDQWCDPDFEWAMWPQAKAPVAPAIRDAVARLDPDADAALVEAQLGVGAAEVIGVTTRLLKVALAPGKTYTMRDLAEFCRRPSLTEPAGLERLLVECRRDLDVGGDIDMALVSAMLEAQFP